MPFLHMLHAFIAHLLSPLALGAPTTLGRGLLLLWMFACFTARCLVAPSPCASQYVIRMYITHVIGVPPGGRLSTYRLEEVFLNANLRTARVWRDARCLSTFFYFAP